MRNYVKYAAIALGATIALSGCIRDEIGPCPGFTVVLTVKDRLYANSDEMLYDDPHAGQVNFDEIVPTLYYVLRDANTGEVVREMPVTHISSDGEKHTIEFDDQVTYGQYTLTVWGGARNDDEIGNDPLVYDLSDLDHEIYLANDTIDYTFGNEVVQGQMQRANGIVIVETIWETFPKGINASEKTFSNLYQTVDQEMNYDNKQSMLVHHSFDTSAKISSTTILPPSIRENSTGLVIKYYSAEHPEYKGLTTEPIKLTVRRNQVTKIRISFDPYSQSIKIATMVNGEWKEKSGMKVD